MPGHSKINIPALTTFFAEFSAIRDSVGKRSVQKELSKLPAFFSGFNEIQLRIANYKQQHSPDYNLFNVLRINHLETVTHTPFLANLLNPTASHAQGSIFLHSFLQKVVGMEANDASFQWLETIENKVTTNRLGNIDILIHGKCQGKPFALVIENKIGAGDQDKQLERYYRYVSEIMSYEPEQIKLIYLSPHGGAPMIPHAISAILYNDLVYQNVLLLRNYRHDIVSWLEQCLSEIPSNTGLFFSLIQYINTIKFF